MRQRKILILLILSVLATGTATARDPSKPGLYDSGAFWAGLASEGGFTGGYRIEWFTFSGTVLLGDYGDDDYLDGPIPGGIDPQDQILGWRDAGAWGLDLGGQMQLGKGWSLGAAVGFWQADEVFLVRDGIAGTGLWLQEDRSETDIQVSGMAQRAFGKKGMMLTFGYHPEAGASVGVGWRLGSGW